jgi:ubiquinone/menaquinone biosynthesis C-methylase UbiE
MVDAPFLAATRNSYDALAASHAEVVASSLEDRPIDRALFAAFADLVRAGGNGPVADVGCGPGRVTILLSELGLDAFGIDLSPGMLALARRTYPHLRFEEGSMLALDLPDASLGGLLAYYSIIHIPWDQRPQLFTEFHRVLTPGAPLMLTFQIGTEQAQYTELFGTPVTLDVYRQDPTEVATLLREAGFALTMTAIREREPTEKTHHAYLLAQNPTPEPSTTGPGCCGAGLGSPSTRFPESCHLLGLALHIECVHLDAVIGVRGIGCVRLVEHSEFMLGQPNLAGRSTAYRLRKPDRHVHNQAPGQLSSVHVAGLWSEHVSDDDLDAHGHKIASQAAGVRHAEPLLFPAFLSLPRCGGAGDDQLAHIVHIDKGTPRPTFRESTPRHTLTHRGPTRKDQRTMSHSSADPGHIEDPNLLATVADTRGQQTRAHQSCTAESPAHLDRGFGLRNRSCHFAGNRRRISLGSSGELCGG